MSFHYNFLNHIKELASKPEAPCAEYFIDRTDEEILRSIFYNYRVGKDGSDPKGLRLSPIGFNIVSKFFQPYNIPLPEGYKISTLDVIWLEDRAEWPYYVGYGVDHDGKNALYVFDHGLGIRLKLAGGNISILRSSGAY